MQLKLVKLVPTTELHSYASTKGGQLRGSLLLADRNSRQRRFVWFFMNILVLSLYACDGHALVSVSCIYVILKLT